MIDKLSVVLSTEVISDSVSIAPFVYIAENVRIGKNVTIHPHVTIESGVVIDDEVEIFPGTYIGKAPKGKALGTNNSFDKKLYIGKNCTIGPNAVLYYGDEIGEECMIGDGVSIRENVRIGVHCIIGRNSTINYGTIIGNYVKIMDLSHITSHVVIHDYVFIAPHCSSADDNTFGKEGYDPSDVLGAEIFENVSLGEGVRLLPKVKIGKNAVVGAGAVVTKDVEAGSVAMGIPARMQSLNSSGIREIGLNNSSSEVPAKCC